METKEKVYNHPKASPIERLARIDGESPFSAMLSGSEIAADTTDDMAALSFARVKGVVPEVLEAHVAKSDMFKRPLMSMTFDTLSEEVMPRNSNESAWRKYFRDRPMMIGACADAFLLLRDGVCKPLADRAKHFGVRVDRYMKLRNTAAAKLFQLCNEAEQAWIHARFAQGNVFTSSKNNKLQERESKTPSNRYSSVESGETKKQARFGRDVGCYYARPLTSDDDPDSAFDARGFGFSSTNGLGWCEAHADPSPCKTTYMPGYEPASA